MPRRSKIWLVVAVLFVAINLGGAVYAAAQGELLHTALHLGLLLPGAYLVWRLAPGRYARRTGSEGGEAALPGELASRLTHLEQSVDAVAIEVERIGEGQRFMTRTFTEKGAAEPVEIKTR